MFKKLSTKMLEAFGFLRFAIRPWKFPTSRLEGPQNSHENFQVKCPQEYLRFIMAFLMQRKITMEISYVIISKLNRPWKFLEACLETLKISMAKSLKNTSAFYEH